jgi:hypothetical protein
MQISRHKNQNRDDFTVQLLYCIIDWWRDKEVGEEINEEQDNNNHSGSSNRRYPCRLHLPEYTAISNPTSANVNTSRQY